MDKQLTVSVKGILLAGLVLVALVVAYLLGSNGAATPNAVAATTQSDTPTQSITMTGTGKTTAVPDELAFDLSVTLTRADLDQALSDANQTIGKALDAIAAAGVAKEDTQSSGLSMNPDYKYTRGEPPTLRGYRVNESYSILVRDLSSGGKVINAAIAAGGNSVRVDGIRLQVSDPDSVLGTARADAIADAKTKASEYAEATGRTLGAVIRVSEPTGYSGFDDRNAFSYTVADSAVAGNAALSPTAIRPGQQDLSVDVQVVWELQ